MSGNGRSSRSTRAGGTRLPPSFTDDVMRAIDRAPRPSPARALWSAVLGRSGEDARGALSVAWRITRHSTSMPVMVRAQALALVVLVAGSMVGGGVLGAVAAYRTVEPIVHSFSAQPDEGARSRPDVLWTPRSPAPTETPPPPDPRRSVTSDGSDLPRDGRDDPGLDQDDDPGDGGDSGESSDEVDGDGDEVDDDGDEVDDDHGDGDEVDDDHGDGDEVDDDGDEVDGDGDEVDDDDGDEVDDDDGDEEEG
jgi:hypothetical protein